MAARIPPWRVPHVPSPAAGTHTAGRAGREAAGAILLGILPQELEPVTQAVAQVGQVLPGTWLWEWPRVRCQARQG